jgi:hypothetical protein
MAKLLMYHHAEIPESVWDRLKAKPRSLILGKVPPNRTVMSGNDDHAHTVPLGSELSGK